jgi:hypothetical protein
LCNSRSNALGCCDGHCRLYHTKNRLPIIALIRFNRMKGPPPKKKICFVFMKSTSGSVNRLNVVPLYLQKMGGGEVTQNKIEKQITSETNRWVRAHTFSKPTTLPAWRLIREKLGVGGGLGRCLKHVLFIVSWDYVHVPLWL